jgi:aryl-alcohol dehydrogenase-like predicted oxidoreductase
MFCPTEMNGRSRKVKADPSQSRATPSGTEHYAGRWRDRFAPDFYRRTRTGLTMSSVAMGTYLGDSDDETDALYADALRAALSCGVNTVDTAINYRCQRSERVIGRVIAALEQEGTVRRDQVVLCTKAGYVPLDTQPPASREDYQAYLKKEYVDTGVLAPAELVGGGHAMSPAFLADQLQRSLRNLGVQAIDYFYLHNPEQQLAAIPNDEFARRIQAAFELLEQLVADGTIGAYGCATWDGLRLPAGSRGHLSLYELAAIATKVGGKDHHFRVAQLPINLTMSEAVRISTQRDARGRLIHVVDAASELGIDLVASAPLLQGQLADNLPPQVREMFPGSTDAQRALAFTRSVPSVVSAAVGMKRRDHVEENLAGCRLP